MKEILGNVSHEAENLNEKIASVVIKEKKRLNLQ